MVRMLRGRAEAKAPMWLLHAGDDLSHHLPAAATWCLVGALGAVWLQLRIRILRRRDALRDPGEPPTPAWRWMRDLANRSGVLPALTWLTVGLFLAALLVTLGGR